MDHAAGRKKEKKSFTEREGMWFSHKIGIQTPVPFLTFMGKQR